MARPLRLEFPGAIYHLTGRGNARQKVFFTDADRELFLNTLAGVVSRYHWICHAYCLMANHYHLLVETPKHLTKRQEELYRELAELDKKHVTPQRKSFFEKLKGLFTAEPGGAEG